MTNDPAHVGLDNEALDRLEVVDVLARDFLARFRAGDRPSIDDYAQRHPDLATDILRMFPLVASVEKLKIDDQESIDGRATLAGRELQRLGDFRIIREIGRGGMGIVYEAEQETLGRRVAIKVLPKQSLLEDHELARFHQEAQTAAAMHHSNIVPIYGTGDFEGSHYLVMQLVEGESLEERLATQQAPLSFSHTAQIGTQVANAIAYAHENGVLHRDIKPANILIDNDGTPQVTDFGVATNINDRNPTKSRTFSGSLRYMAPERFRGVSQPGSDVYSIGLTLYEMLVGKPAFEQTDTNELLAILSSPPAKSIKQHRPDVPVDLETIVLKAMNAEPEKRYESAAELRADLQRFLSNEPIKARRISLVQKGVRWCRRDPKTAIASAIAVAALVTATIASSAAWFVASAANDRTTSALNSSEEITNLAIETLDEVVNGISLAPSTGQLGIADEDLIDWERSSADAFVSASPHTAQVLERLQPLYEGLLEQAPTRPDIVRQMVDASVQHARILNQLGNTDDAIKTIHRGISILKSHSKDAQMPGEETSVRLMRLHNELGLYHTAAYQFEAADESHQWVLSTFDAKSDPDADSQLELARANVFLGDLPPSRRRNQRDFRDRRNWPNSEVRRDQTQHLDAALKLLKQLESGQKSPLKEIVVDILKARCYLGLSRLVPNRRGRQSNFDLAIKTLESRLVDSPKANTVRFELVKAFSDQQLRGPLSDYQIQNATSALNKSLDYIQPLREEFPKSPAFAVGEIHIRHKLSSLAMKRGDFPDAEATIKVAIEIQTNLIESYPQSTTHRCWRALLYRSLAEAMGRQNQHEESITVIEKAKADIEKLSADSSDHPFVIRVRKAVFGFSAESR